MAKKPDKPEPQTPHADPVVINLLILILLETKRTNKILRITELNNQQRHEELIAVLTNPDASKIVFRKLRREPIG